jgi:hypothetical protein
LLQPASLLAAELLRVAPLAASPLFVARLAAFSAWTRLRGNRGNRGIAVHHWHHVAALSPFAILKN